MDIGLERFVTGLTDNLEPPVRKHLKNVYASVTLASFAAAAGGYAHLYSTLIGAGLMTGFGAIGLMLLLLATPHNGKNQAQRLALLTGFGFLSGCNLGPLLEIAQIIDSTVIMEALLGTGVVFVCFSLAALYAPRGYYLYLGGSLLSVICTMSTLALLNLFIGSRLLFQVHLYTSLAVMCGFVLYDTQCIVEKRRLGSDDYVSHALELFIDFIAIFRKLLIILSDKRAQQEQQQRKKRRN